MRYTLARIKVSQLKNAYQQLDRVNQQILAEEEEPFAIKIDTRMSLIFAAACTTRILKFN